jgi:ferritin-like metal-binding protein YciE
VARVAARAEPVVPRTLGMLEDHFEHLEVATYTIVLVVAPQF